jgi:hypothetical protein
MNSVMKEKQYHIHLSELICRYGFDLDDVASQDWIIRWMSNFPSQWIYLAILEALHQGRYKIISVEQLLNRWLRKGRPSYHFKEDFESLINRAIPEELLTKIKEPSEYNPSLKPESSIEKFIVQSKASDFYDRLKHLAQQTT